MVTVTVSVTVVIVKVSVTVVTLNLTVMTVRVTVVTVSVLVVTVTLTVHIDTPCTWLGWWPDMSCDSRKGGKITSNIVTEQNDRPR